MTGQRPSSLCCGSVCYFSWHIPSSFRVSNETTRDRRLDHLLEEDHHRMEALVLAVEEVADGSLETIGPLLRPIPKTRPIAAPLAGRTGHLGFGLERLLEG